MSDSRIQVQLRPALVGDAKRLLECINPAIPDLQNFSIFSKGPLTVDEERKYLQRMMRSATDQLFLVLAEGTIVGTTGLHEIDRYNHAARIGTIIFDPGNRGHHYGSQAIELTFEYGFEKLGLNKIYGQTFRENTAVLALHKKLGFVEEGILRQEYFLRGQYHDMVRESVLRSEWEQRRFIR